jgi:hypothetical protein
MLLISSSRYIPVTHAIFYWFPAITVVSLEKIDALVNVLVEKKADNDDKLNWLDAFESIRRLRECLAFGRSQCLSPTGIARITVTKKLDILDTKQQLV